MPVAKDQNGNPVKVGDILKGTDAANIYAHTDEGWSGRVLQIEPNGHVIVEGSDGDLFTVESYRFINKSFVPKPRNVDLKLDVFDGLIIADDVKNEIIAVLKQHKHGPKMFDEWGLGAVIEYGKGMTFLFYGGPGTGKTWAAHCIAKAMGTELLVITAAEIQSSEPGAANRNIQSAFANAKSSGKVLFIDECDSLITSRNDVGMIIASEINSLLTEIEKFEGVCILATNRVEDLDEALERRISLIAEFPEPNFEQRELIWKRLMPPKMPLGDDVKTEYLAEFKLTGGQIKNAVLQAARLALAEFEEDPKQTKVAKSHFETSIMRIQKSRSLLGSASQYRNGKIRDYLKTKGRDTTIATEIAKEVAA